MDENGNSTRARALTEPLRSPSKLASVQFHLQYLSLKRRRLLSFSLAKPDPNRARRLFAT